MVTKEYSMAYTEVIKILSYVPDEDIAKIPKEKIDFYKSNMDKEYEYKLDMSKEFEEQEMSNITEAILANIFRDYWTTPSQKERIEKKEQYDLWKIEEEKSKKYNPDNIFKRRKNENPVEGTTANIVAMTEYRESIFKKIINKIRSIFFK